MNAAGLLPKPVTTSINSDPIVQKAEALRLWNEKLEYLQTQKVMAPDAAQDCARKRRSRSETQRSPGSPI